MSNDALKLTAMLLLSILTTGCVEGDKADESRTPRQATEMTAADAILGTWRRTSVEDCAARYPEEIGFLEGGIYIAEAPAGEFRQWQSGDYELVGERQIRIQTANDAMRLYGFSIGVDGKLRFVDDDRCEITYERVARE